MVNRSGVKSRWSQVMASWCIAALGAVALSLHATPLDDPLGEKAGGDTTVYADGLNAFSFSSATLTEAERTRFAVGNSFFRRNWVQAPASTTARDGLGPHFIARSCGGCHLQDGRGRPPEPRAGTPEQPVALLMRLSVPGAADPKLGVHPEPVYGDQFDNAAVQGVQPEGEVTIHYTPVRGRFADGSAYALNQPTYGFRKLAYGPMARGVMVSPRIAPQMIGVGLIEAISDADILQNAADQAAAGGAIRGMPNRVWDAVSGQTMLGRFGWKANTASLAHQTAAAFRGDIGITSSIFPTEACSAEQTDCLAAPRGNQGNAQSSPQNGAPEIDDKTFSDVVFYTSTLAPPARRAPDDAQVLQGQKLFAQAECSTCHRPSYTTRANAAALVAPAVLVPALSGQRIWPYTDLLLHGMGAGLADGRPDFLATGQQWKTPPLWGIGLIKDVNGHTNLLHDGRARGVLEAVLWHGGEAAGSQQKVIHMSAQERAALVKFVESL
jgi:CxxC motif-containing protein (DUF1111 family)